MPRGPGKKENYNFDYSRFDGVDQEVAIQADADVGPDQAAEMLRHLPGELQEAFRLMQLARETGDVKAQERANELALKAVEKGGPEMKQRFQQEVLRQAAKDPEAKKGVEALINSQDPSYSAIRTPNADALAAEGDRLDHLSGNIDRLQAQMKAGQERASAQLEAMRQQQEKLESLNSPEDFSKFVAEQGFTPEDMQRILSGDEEYLRTCIDRALGERMQGADPTTSEESKKLDEALNTVEKIHRELNDVPDSEPPPLAIEPPAPAPATEKKKEAKKPAAPEPKLAEHRVQYLKDDAGKLLSVELRCELPGVAKMADVELDISDKYLRLRTLAPAYVVNVGPFPSLVDAPATQAKFSKKRQELTVTVPALP